MEQKKDKGVAGLTILLSLIVMLFIIGLIVMIFAIMSAELSASNYVTTTVSVANESIGTPLTAGRSLSVSGYRDVSCTINQVINGTVTNTTISSGNYTQTNCVIANTTSSYTGAWRVTYDYTWSADTTATDVINDTSGAISSVVDWYDIFIVIGAMVVLILLVVIIISSIRGSGMVNESNTENKNIGTA